MYYVWSTPPHHPTHCRVPQHILTLLMSSLPQHLRQGITTASFKIYVMMFGPPYGIQYILVPEFHYYITPHCHITIPSNSTSYYTAFFTVSSLRVAHRCLPDPTRRSWWSTLTRFQPMSSSSSSPSRTRRWARRQPSPRWTTSSRRPKTSWMLYQRWWRPALSAPPRWVGRTREAFAMRPNFLSLSPRVRSSEALPCCIFSRHSLTLGGGRFLLSRVFVPSRQLIYFAFSLSC